MVMPGTEAVSWTVLDDSGEPVGPIEGYLSHLSAIERSPHTVRGYAIGLKLWFEFLAGTGVSWNGAGLDDVGRFVAWLRAPGAALGLLRAMAANRPRSTSIWPPSSGSTTIRPGWA